MADLRVVFDSNVVVSAMLLRGSTSRSVFDLVSASGRILISSASILELEDVLRRPKFDRYLSESERMEFLIALVEAADLVRITERVVQCRDHDDDKYLEIRSMVLHRISSAAMVICLRFIPFAEFRFLHHPTF